jgi:hypothetical protein
MSSRAWREHPDAAEIAQIEQHLAEAEIIANAGDHAATAGKAASIFS